MRNEWVGDIGDFGKYGLLRELFGRPEEGQQSDPQLAVVWCHNQDQGVARLEIPERLQPLDVHLYQQLAGIPQDLHEVESRAILNTDRFYYNTLAGLSLPQRIGNWRTEALESIGDANVVFVDPDTGIAVPQNGNSPLHVYVDELAAFRNAGKSLIVYHHLNRRGAHPQQVWNYSKRLTEALDLPGAPWVLWWHGTSIRIYFVIPTGEHKDWLHQMIIGFGHSPWCIDNLPDRPPFTCWNSIY